jgi:hypothetical protein
MLEKKWDADFYAEEKSKYSADTEVIDLESHEDYSSDS